MVLRSPESLSVRTRLCQLGIDPRDDSPDHQGTHEAATEPRHITAKATRRGSGLVDSLRQAFLGAAIAGQLADFHVAPDQAALTETYAAIAEALK